MRKLFALFMFACAQPDVAFAAPVPCCTSAEIQTLGDLNYLARAALNHTGPLRDRLYILAQLLKAGTWRQWNDADRSYILGLMAATPDGLYPPNRELLNTFAAEVGVPIATVTIPAPSPVVVPAPLPIPAPVPGAELVVPRLCVGGPCDPKSTYVMQIAGPDGASILLRSNLSGRNPQGAAEHRSIVTLDGDGGVRIIHNWECTTDGCHWVEPSKPRTIWAFDSQGTWSLSQDYDGVIYPSQKIIMRYDRNTNRFIITGMMPGMKVCLQSSVQVNDFAGPMVCTPQQ